MIGFKSRPRVGGDQSGTFRLFSPRMFQVTPPCRGRLKGFVMKPTTFGFKSRPRVGGDVQDPEGGTEKLKFQVTPPCRGRR